MQGIPLVPFSLVSGPRSRRRRQGLRSALTAFIVAVPCTAVAAPGLPSNGRISFGSFFSETNGRADILGMTDDARFVTYVSAATNITNEDTNPRLDCYRYDRFFGVTLLMSVGTGGQAGNGQAVRYASNGRMITPDGRYALFTSYASDLIPSNADNNGKADVFVRDTNGVGSTQRVSLTTGDKQITTGDSFALGMSIDALKILFTTNAPLVGADTNGVLDVYLYNRTTKQIKLVSEANGVAVGSGHAVLSENGNYVAFTTSKSLVAADTNQVNDVYWKDLTSGNNRLASVSVNGAPPDGPSEHPAISGDGTRVAFISRATNIVGGGPSGANVFVKNLSNNTVFRASTATGGAQSGNPVCDRVSLSGTGQFVAMACRGNGLQSGDPNASLDVFVKDLTANTTTLVSRIPDGVIGNGDSSFPIISKNGAEVGFTSAASNLVSPDANAAADVFVALRQ
jgi:hypothetical protein